MASGRVGGQQPDEERRSQRNSDVVEALIDDQMPFLTFKGRWQGPKVNARMSVRLMKLEDEARSVVDVHKPVNTAPETPMPPE